MTEPHHCGFCGKGQSEIRILIAGPENLICDQCVMLCVDILVGRTHVERNPPIPLAPAEPTTSPARSPSSTGAQP